MPLTRFQVRNSRSQGGITVRLAPGDPDTVEIRFFDADGRDIDPGVQRKIERLAVPGGLPAGLRRRHRRHRVPAPLARVLHGRARAGRRHRSGAPAHVQDRARLLVRRSVDRDAEPAHEARRRGVGGEPVREHRVGHVDRRGARRPGRRASPSWCRCRGAISASSSIPTASWRSSSTTPATSSSPRSCCSPGDAHQRGGAGRERGGAGERHRCGRADPRRAGRGGAHEAVGGQPHGVRRRPQRDVRGHARRRLHLARVPARLRRRGHPGEAARPPRRGRPSTVGGGRRPARASTWPTRRSSPRGSARAR